MDYTSSPGQDGVDEENYIAFPGSVNGIFNQIDKALADSLIEKKKPLRLSVIGVFINKADIWFDEEEIQTLNKNNFDTLVQENISNINRDILFALAARPYIKKATKCIPPISIFVKSTSLRKSDRFETPEALELLARHSTMLADENLKNLKGSINNIIKQIREIPLESKRAIIDNVRPKAISSIELSISCLEKLILKIKR